MNATARRLVLAIALVFAAPFFWFQCYVTLDYRSGWYFEWALGCSTAITAALFGVCWWQLWRRCVVWTRVRVLHTAYLTVAATVTGVAIGWLIDWGVGAALGGALWVAGTAWLWGTPEARRRSADGVGVPCRKCGYDLRGLHEARCPECGTLYTLDELVADALNDLRDDE